MKKQLEEVAKSYDKAIELGRKGIDAYQNLPIEIIGHPYYCLFQEMQTSQNLSDSGRPEIFDFLIPDKGMNFIDLGCCLNLMFRGYREWKSTYYGIDISKKTIELLQEYVKKNKLLVGSFVCGSMHHTPYESSFFDIGCCIGSLEYFEQEFVQQTVMEIHRIMKPNGKFVLDIPKVGSAEFEITAMIEEYLGRKDKFNMSILAFEILLKPYFTIVKKEIVGPMIQYFLVCKK